ncbi:MAG: DUF2232 domain-containing protein [Spirochaetia bacterium]
MPDHGRRAYWTDVVGLAVAAVLLFRSGLLLLVFLIPIQIVWVRRGERAGLLSSGFFLGALAFLKFVDYLRIRSMLNGASGGLGLLFLDIVLPVAFLAGLYLLNTPRLIMRVADGVHELSVVERFGATVLTAAIIYVPTIVLVYLSGSVDGIIAAQVELISSLLIVVDATADEILALTRLVIRIFLSGFLFGFFIILVGGWWLGTGLALGKRLALPGPNEVAERLRMLSITRFCVPGVMIWIVIAAWGAVLVSMLVDVGWLSFVMWNFAFLTLAMYAIQGLAVIWHLLDRRKIARAQRVGLAVALVIGLLIPGLNLVFLLGLPGLGISEVWVNYHRFDSNGDEQ